MSSENIFPPSEPIEFWEVLDRVGAAEGERVTILIGAVDAGAAPLCLFAARLGSLEMATQSTGPDTDPQGVAFVPFTDIEPSVMGVSGLHLDPHHFVTACNGLDGLIIQMGGVTVDLRGDSVSVGRST